MQQLITAQEFATYRNISKKLDVGKINECILEAQQSDLLTTLDDFYFDVLKNANEASYTDLMEGSIFEVGGYEYQQAGIKALLADYVYSRYIYNLNVQQTPFGARIKTSDNSEAVDRNTLKDMAKQSQQDAGYKFKYIDKYLTTDPVLFERYYKNNNRCEEQNNNRNFKSIKTSVL